MLPKLHPEINEHVSIPEFTHWMLIPENDKFRAFVKPVTFDRFTNKNLLKSKGIKIFPISQRPQGYPTAPEYK